MHAFAVSWTINGTGAHHVTDARTGPEAVRLARSVYAALYCAGLGERSGGTAPAVFEEIRKPACARVTAEPGNRAFTVAIEKRRRAC